ncbi:WD40-repeat-containing domain protein [Ampelomyces quisqualis]|uniref:Pre-rRNA-processing protein IPI3 n=1 Tax=Ampelomyces quisqualis TaxID=50730 RepID=A0A6A5QEC8_AMPQU|nr:WD40-repeat-containing domain protein [Ampelomyces quisqualis]
MLTELLVAAISAPTKPNTGVTKDAGIFVHEHQPLAAPRHVFKKSAAAPNGIAVSSSHVFAAQADTAVVHVYSRAKGSQEAIVPFPERIHSIALAADDTVLLLGTASGRICSGRLVSTSTAHLQPVTSVAADRSSSFFLSGSSDAMVHVWALPAVLSFSPDTSRTPVHTLATHRGPISSIACGHSARSANIAVSASADKSVIVWDYHNGHALRTYLLPEAPTAVTLDPADRALHVAYADGSLQTVDFYDDVQKTASSDLLRDPSLSHRPVQPSPKTRFAAESQKLGGALSLTLSWDGTTLVSGHASGKVVAWDVAKGNYLSTLTNLPGPVSNLQFLQPIGFPHAPEPSFKVHTVVKPKQDSGAAGAGSGLIPPGYTLNMQLTGRLRTGRVSAADKMPTTKDAFEDALTHPSFPASMLEEGLAELESWTAPSRSGAASASEIIALDLESHVDPSDSHHTELRELKKQLASLQRIQKVTFSQLSDLRAENEFFRGREMAKAERARTRAKKRLGITNGVAPRKANEDVDMDGGDVSSSASDSEPAGVAKA